MRILYLPNSYCQQRQLEKPNFLAYPVRLAMEATYERDILKNEVYWDKPEMMSDITHWRSSIMGYNFLKLPHPDRVWTDAKNKKYQRNGNFKYHPGTYIQSASGCWWGKCEFCVEKGQKYEVRPVEDVIQEIEEIKSQGYRECFDDSATFPVGNWSDSFCGGLIERRNKLVLGCNMRIVNADFLQMKAAGFRMLLFGLESANEKTLNRINKGVKVENIIPTIKKASEAGIDVHTAWMFGYPWETDRDSIRSLNLCHYLLRRGYSKTAQASFYCPKDGEGNETQRKYVRKIYEVAYSPQFWFNQIRDIKNKDDLKYLWRKIKAAIYG
uniref:Putative radical SAM superfamily protein n=1 Tax=viral metagenome TaxID=1070528 RepID=A0A6M3ISQ6_9ZZZZ